MCTSVGLVDSDGSTNETTIRLLYTVFCQILQLLLLEGYRQVNMYQLLPSHIWLILVPSSCWPRQTFLFRFRLKGKNFLKISLKISCKTLHASKILRFGIRAIDRYFQSVFLEVVSQFWGCCSISVLTLTQLWFSYSRIGITKVQWSEKHL